MDLAGSERSGQYAVNTEQLREGAHINLSLSTLGRVVSALARGQGDHVPSRDSALTWLLTDAITGHKARAFMTPGSSNAGKEVLGNGSLNFEHVEKPLGFNMFQSFLGGSPP